MDCQMIVKKWNFLLQYCRNCFTDTLDKNLVKGKIVLCDGQVDREGPLLAGAVGTVYQGRRTDAAFSFPLPASYLRSEDGASVYLYVNTTRYKSKITWTMKKFRKNVYTSLSMNVHDLQGTNCEYS
jgi:hypothetical protein